MRILHYIHIFVIGFLCGAIACLFLRVNKKAQSLIIPKACRGGESKFEIIINPQKGNFDLKECKNNE